jgi:hypothetical protein
VNHFRPHPVDQQLCDGGHGAPPVDVGCGKRTSLL